jgi:hypothetical protein
MRYTYTLSIAALLWTSSAVMAHDMAKGVNGGQVVDAKGHHIEFITKDAAITLFLTDDKDQPIASAGASGRVIIQAAGATTTTDLTPAEPNLLTAKASAPLAPGDKLVVSAKLSDGHELQARFATK